MATAAPDPIAPSEILRELLAFDPSLRRERYWGECSVLYNPGRSAPLGVIFASIKDHDGENDSSSRLSREGVYRFAFSLARETYARASGSPRRARPRAVSSSCRTTIPRASTS